LDGVGKSAGNADKQLKEFTSTQQRAAMRMEKMHEEAMKMNQGFVSTNDKAQAFSATLSKVSTTATASAAALGLPIGQLTALNAASDVAGLGMSQLTKSMVGFNAASVGVVGAGLAIGLGIGTLIRDIPIVTKKMDEWGESVARFFGAAIGFQTDKIEGGASQAAKATVDLLRSQGKSLEEIRGLYKEMPPEMDKYIVAVGKRAEADKKAAKATKEAADEALKAYEQWLSAPAPWEFTVPLPRYGEGLEDIVGPLNMGGQGNFTSLMGFAPGGGMPHQMQTQFEIVGKDAGVSFADGMKTALHDLPEVILGALQGGGSVGGSIGALFGGTIFGKDSALMKGLTGPGGLLSKGIGGALGSVIPGLGTMLGGMLGDLGGKLFGKLFGGEEKKVNDMRDAFFEAAGGFEALAIKLSKTGDQDLVKKIFDTKTVKDFEAAVKEAQAALDLQDLAQRKLNEAMQRYGILGSEMGQKFRLKELNAEALQLWSDWELMSAAMEDTTVLATKMAPSMQEYIDAAKAAGATIPENLRPIIEQMIALGLLTDESGAAFGSLEEAGLTFGAAVEDSMKAAADAVLELVSVIRQLYGLPPVNIPVTVPGVPGLPGAGVSGGPAGEGGPGGPIPGLALGGHITSSGLAYLHAGETVVSPYAVGGPGDEGGLNDPPIQGGPAAPPVPFDEGGSGGGGGGGGGGGSVSGGPAGGPVGMGGSGGSSGIRQSFNVAFAPNISISGAGNDQEMARMMKRMLRENRQGVTSDIEAIAIRAQRRL
jgi:hypothetical protein